MPSSQKNHQKSKMEIPLQLEALPALVLLHIAKHLPTDDARNFSLTCKKIMNILPIYPPPLIIRSQSFSSLMEDLRQVINKVSSFSRYLNGTFP